MVIARGEKAGTVFLCKAEVADRHWEVKPLSSIRECDEKVKKNLLITEDEKDS